MAGLRLAKKSLKSLWIDYYFLVILLIKIARVSNTIVYSNKLVYVTIHIPPFVNKGGQQIGISNFQRKKSIPHQ